MKMSLQYMAGVIGQIGQASKAYQNEKDRILAFAQQGMEDIEEERRSEKNRINHEFSVLFEGYADAQEERDHFTEDALVFVSHQLKNIDEPHWQ